LLRRLVARFTVDEIVAVVDKKRITKTEKTDRRSNLAYISRIELAEFSGGGSKLFEPNVGKLQTRKPVDAPPRGGR
jgi:hypothetical protein